ncbi:MAG: hypothetical protein ABIG84_05215 [archaeon]
MNLQKICWCINQKKGIRLIDLKPHLSESYILEADETLENVFTAKGKWKLITAYYAAYNALYSILMKSGIRCEIHDCTIELMSLFGFTDKDTEYMRDLKDKRIQAQYYLKNIALDDEQDVKRFILECKLILSSLNSEKIEKIRSEISKAKESPNNDLSSYNQ